GERAHRLVAREVALVGLGADAVLQRELAGEGAQALEVARDQQEVEAALRELQGELAAEYGRGAGDAGEGAGEVLTGVGHRAYLSLSADWHHHGSYPPVLPSECRRAPLELGDGHALHSPERFTQCLELRHPESSGG